jgi:ATP-binding cassette subfamily C protein LapB
MEIEMNISEAGLLKCLSRLLLLQQHVPDRERFREVIDAIRARGPLDGRPLLDALLKEAQLPEASWSIAPDPARLPALVWREGPEASTWGVLLARDGTGQWVSQWWDCAAQRWVEESDLQPPPAVAMLNLASTAEPADHFRSVVWRACVQQKALLRDLVAGGFLINIIALASSLYSMQVYDRVVPTGAMQTLMVLTFGVLGAAAFELLAKRTRAMLYDRLVDEVDRQLARAVYARLLAVRLDQMPRSVGGLASQLRGYETVRAFLTGLVNSALVDAPFALLFLAVIASISVPVALIPLAFLVLSLTLGCYALRNVSRHAKAATGASNLKTGLLVESVEGAEIIKSGQGGWRMLARWLSVTDHARSHESAMRSLGERSLHHAAFLQQCSYVLIVAQGAVLIGRGELTMGALVACSILSGRVLAPIAAIPHHLIQWAHTRSAYEGVERLWALAQDEAHGSQAVALSTLSGNYQLAQVTFAYEDRPALQIAELSIAAGEKVAILGPVGAGKTTLLRLLSGMYRPQTGRILLDGVAIEHIARPALADKLAYLPQDGRLFAGTLRENLLLGMADPGDDAVLRVADMTGLLQAVIQGHPKGLFQDIHEGGTGLSGGQRQLVQLTRVFLRAPRIWLLDEPSAAMDRQLELRTIGALRQSIAASDTLVLVTHKVEMLALVDRLVVVAGHRIVLDGPKAQVLHQLDAGSPPGGMA